MKPKTKSGYDDQMCKIFHGFARTQKGEPVDLDDLYEHAEKEQLWDAQRLSKRAMFKRDMSRALSRERITDESGVRVRRNHVFRVKNNDEDGGYLFFWGELMKMKPGHVKMSMQQRLLGLANRAIQLDRDKTYYNENNTFGAQLTLDYDLNPHVENSKNPTEWPKERPEEEQ